MIIKYTMRFEHKCQIVLFKWESKETQEKQGLNLHISSPDLHKGVRKSDFIPLEHVFY